MSNPCSVAVQHVDFARQLLRPASPENVVCAAAVVLQKQMICSTMQLCTFYWVFLALLFGFREYDVLEAPEHEARKDPWQSLFHNVTLQMWRIRGKHMLQLALEKLHFYGHPPAPKDELASTSSMLLLYADSDKYFAAWHVAPFVEQLRCYTSMHGIQFALDSKGPRIPHKGLYIINRSIEGEFYLSYRGEDKMGVKYARELILDLFDRRRLERAAELVDVEHTLALNYAHPYQFGRIWAMSEHLSALEPGALLLFFDADVTIRPDSRHKSLAQLLLAQSKSGNAPHIFIADTWMGTECVNSGFFAVRNTAIGHVFLELWKEKMWWASSWDQAALAETVLEILGAEIWKASAGKQNYDLRCLPRLFPLADGTYSYTRYCDCWHATVHQLAGPYRLRRSRVVGFVDPEEIEVNFIPNNIFWQHNYELSSMHLVPTPGQPLFTPMVIHWAGIGPRRLTLMQQFLATFNVNTSDACLAFSEGRKNTEKGASSLGTKSRHLRCCKQLRKHADKSKWPWNLPHNGWTEWVQWWGCSDWRSVTAEDCDELIGPELGASMDSVQE